MKAGTEKSRLFYSMSERGIDACKFPAQTSLVKDEIAES
jgi:hypothetical protein